MMKKEQHENAVSPVVGVMLMLVVTIILAAVVASFAGGISTSTEATPMVTFGADYRRTDGLVMTINSISSGSIDTDNLIIQVSNVGSTEFIDVSSNYFSSSTGYLKAGTVLTSSIVNFDGAIEAYGETPTKAHYITAADVYDITGEEFTVRLVYDGAIIGIKKVIITARSQNN